MAWIPKQRVVVPVDFSDDSFAALDTALELVSKPSSIHVIYVLPVFEPAEPGMVWTGVDEGGRRKHAEEALHERLDAPKYQGLNFHIAFGDPGHEIADFAQSLNAELIVIPSHGRRGLTRLLLGSVSEKVLRLAHCPVLVMRK